MPRCSASFHTAFVLLEAASEVSLVYVRRPKVESIEAVSEPRESTMKEAGVKRRPTKGLTIGKRMREVRISIVDSMKRSECGAGAAPQYTHEEVRGLMLARGV